FPYTTLFRSDEVDHSRMAARSRLAERQSHDGAQVVFELTGHRPLDGPVSRVMYTRGHLVGHQPSAAHEKLDGEHSHVREGLEHTRETHRRRPAQARRAPGGDGQAQDALAVVVAIQRIDDDAAIARAR